MCSDRDHCAIPMSLFGFACYQLIATQDPVARSPTSSYLFSAWQPRVSQGFELHSLLFWNPERCLHKDQ